MLLYLMLIAELVTAFLGWNERHRAAATVRGYGGRLQSFVRAFGEREWDSLKPLEVDEWLQRACTMADGSRVAPDTERLTIVSFERLQGWSVDNKLVEAKIFNNALEKPRGRQRDRVPTEAETRKLLKKASRAFRDIYQALRLCGARPNELVRARIEDLDPALGAIILAEHKTARKVGKPRVIPIGDKLADLIKRVIGQRPGGHIFLDERGEPWTTQRLSRKYRELRDAAGLERDLVLYMARHEHGTAVTKKFGIHAACKALGHASITTTQRYAHMTTDELRANQDALEL